MRLQRVGKRYGIRRPWIVRDVSMEIEAGRLIRLEGRNGSGKSTLLRVIAGVSAPSSGVVTGRPGTGYVPERFPPGLPFSARDYLTHLGRMHGLAGPALAARIDECLDRLGGSEFAAVPLRTMSKGMCQKVAVAQALLPRPGLLVLDEAWTGLDTAARAALDGAVAERLAEGGAVVFVDHDQSRLAEHGAERWQVSHGRVEVIAEADPRAAAGPGPGPATADDSMTGGVVAAGHVGDGPAGAGPAGAGLVGGLAGGGLAGGGLAGGGLAGGGPAGGGPAGGGPAGGGLTGGDAAVAAGGRQRARAARLAAAGWPAVIAISRYQVALLLRSHRWIPPAVLYALAVVGLGGGSPPLGDGLRWSALMLVPAVAWLTRSMLTAEPAAARACVAAAGGPRRAQLAALVAALAIGTGYALGGVGYELITGDMPGNATGAVRVAATFSALAGGLVATLICLLVGSAVGALCNPPLIRRPAAGMLSTTGAVVLALAWNVSPANAAARTVGSAAQAITWLPGLPMIAAVVLLVIAWTGSALAAGHRSG